MTKSQEIQVRLSECRQSLNDAISATSRPAAKRSKPKWKR